MLLTILAMSGAALASQEPTVPTFDAPVVWRRPPPPWRRPPPQPPARPSTPPQTEHSFTLSLSTLPLTEGLFEMTGEARLGAHSSIDLIGGAGYSAGAPRFEIGLQGRGYFLGNFDRGLGLGLEGTYTNLSLGTTDDRVVTLGPLLAAKYTLPFPLTLEGQLGAAYVQGNQWAGIEPIGRVTIGWTF